MDSQSNTQRPSLVEALAAVTAEDSPENRADVLIGLATSPVTVMLDHPWDGVSLPAADTRFLLVSDGEDIGQPMLALFSTDDRARQFREQVQIGDQFEHLVEVSGSWSLLGVSDGMGVMIDPNLDSAFRIGPDMATKLRNDVEEAMARVSARKPDGDTPDEPGE